MNTHPTRYHRALVVLHWLLAVLLIVTQADSEQAFKK